MQILFDRSRHESYEKCPRLRFLQYEYPTQIPAHTCNGLQRKALAVPLLTGSMVHKGIELFLTGGGEGYALDAALTAYDEEVEKRGIELDELAPGPEWTVKVQRALIEALVSGWISFVYPRIEAEYDILEVEREERAVFETMFEDAPGPAQLILMARTDCIVRRKSDGKLFVRNVKTMGDPQLRKLEAFRYDTQTISEVLAVEQRLKDEAYANAVHAPGGPSSIAEPVVSGVIYDLLVKGPRKQEFPKGSGQWHNNSPLVWAFVREGQTGITDDALAVDYYYECDGPHKMGNGRMCEGFQTHSLGPKYKRKLVTDIFAGQLDEHGNPLPAVNAWFNWLQANKPGLIDQQFQSLPPIMRTPFDVETWKRSVLHEELRIFTAAEECREAVQADGFINSLPILDNHFPKHTANGNCLFPTKCPMFDVCWGASGQYDDLLESEEYVPRVPNHPEGVESVASIESQREENNA